MSEIDNVLAGATQNGAPIFVLSLERSGSTLLRNILDAHPAIFSPAQLHVGSLSYWMYQTSFYSISQIATDLSEEERQAAARADVRRVVDELLRGYAAKKNKSIWCDKTTMNLNHINTLAGIFPDARFICLYRNCLDFVASYMSVSKLGFMEEIAPYIQKNPYNLVSAIVDYWLDSNNTILGFEQKNPGKCFRITYERMVSTPDETLGSLFNFLGLSLDDQLLERVFSNKGKGPVDGDIKFQFSTKISTDSIGQGANIPLTSIPPRQLERLNESLAKFGYAPVATSQQLGTAAAITVKSAADKPTQTVGELFSSYFPGLIKNKLGSFRALNCVCKMQVSGDEGGVWTFDLTQPEGSVRAEDANAICTIGVSAEVLKSIVAGKTSALDAFQKGLIGASGDRRMAINFGRLLFGA